MRDLLQLCRLSNAGLSRDEYSGLGASFALPAGMSKRKIVITLALAALTLPSASLAQHEHRATVLLRNGDRVAGNIDGIGNGAVYVRRSQSDQPKIGVGDVAVIDFVGGAQGLPETELSIARGSEHLLLLKDGSSLRGQFVALMADSDTSNEPHTLAFRAAGGEQKIALDRVARLYMGNFPGAGPAAPAAGVPAVSQPVPAGAVRVGGNAGWVPTSIRVNKGDRVTFTASGQVQLSDNPSDTAEPAGAMSQRRAAGSPLPQNFAGALIARVGNSATFPIGNNSAPIVMPADGQLFLSVNDDELGDNRGEFIVQVSHQRSRR